MTDQWYQFWVQQGAGYNNGVNLRPSDYDYYKATLHIHNVINFTQSDNVLDVGCGNGQTVEQISKYTKNISAVDYSKNMILLAQNLAYQKHLTGEYIQTSAENLQNFKDEIFDKVVSIATVQYYIDVLTARQAVDEMVRVCKKGGFVFVGDILDSENIKKGVSGMTSFYPTELGGSYKFKVIRSYFEPHRRFDLIIQK